MHVHEEASMIDHSHRATDHGWLEVVVPNFRVRNLNVDDAHHTCDNFCPRFVSFRILRKRDCQRQDLDNARKHRELDVAVLVGRDGPAHDTTRENLKKWDAVIMSGLTGDATHTLLRPAMRLHHNVRQKKRGRITIDLIHRSTTLRGA